MLYAVGIAVYLWARNERNEPAFRGIEGLLAGVLALAGIAAAYLLWTGGLTV
jgi:hypothetical protein